LLTCLELYTVLDMSKHEEIYAALHQRLTKGEFEVGQDFLSIAEVAQEYGVSSMTAERPLRRLHNGGWILIRQGHRNQVVSLPLPTEPDLIGELKSIRTAIDRLIQHLEKAA
jgi:DNA-binding GntR family transcriptional regulator